MGQQEGVPCPTCQTMNCPWAQQHDLIFQLSWTVATLAADQGRQECGGDRGSLWEAETTPWDPLLPSAHTGFHPFSPSCLWLSTTAEQD